MKIQAYLLFTVLIVDSSALLFNIFKSSSKWNALKVRWGFNPFTSFKAMPRTASQAIEYGFDKISGCDANATYQGARYVKDGDQSLVLLYDVNGYIAGIQTVVPHNLTNDYPRKGLVPPFVEHDDGFYFTAYFVHPDTICSGGRSSKKFKKEGTGSVLLIQTGPNPMTDYAKVPLDEKDLAGTRWVKGKCLPSMGRHYWYDISKNMNCDNFFPLFLMYNKGKLNGFGWAMGADLTSKRWEHPPSRSFKYFFEDPPKCLYERGKISTMHIFLTNRPALNWC